MIKKTLLFFAFLLAGILLLRGVIRFVGWQEIKSTFLIFTGWHGLVIFLLTLLMLFFGLWKWRIILKNQGYDLSLKKLAGPYLAGFSLIYLFPMIIFGGEVFKGYILREKHSIPWNKGMISVIIDRILETTAFLITILAGLIFFLLKIGLPPKNLGMIMGGVLFFFIVLIGFFYFRSFKKESIAKFLAKFFNHKGFLSHDILNAEREIFNFFKPQSKVFWQAFGLAFLRVAVTWLRGWLLILFLGKSVGFLPALSILGFYYFALMIPIPTALGTHEIVQIFSFNAFNIGAGIAPAFTMIQRGAEIAVAIIGLIIFFKLGIGLLQNLVINKYAEPRDR